MRRLRMASITTLCIGAAVLAGDCAGENKKAETPQAEESSALTEENNSDTAATIKFQYYYNGARKQHLDQLVEEYNGTLGLECGVAVEVHSQGSIVDLTDRIGSVLNGTTNDVEMANITLAYRDMVVNTVKLHPDRLVELGSVVPKADLAQYNQAYLNEGYIDGKLYILPMVKSTELPLMNQTRLDEFLDVNPQYWEENMELWRGLGRMVEGYFEWTDSIIPGTDGDGRPFIGVDNLANYFVAMNHAMGSDIYHYDESGTIVPDLNKGIIERLPLNCYEPFTRGYYGAKGRYHGDDIKQSYLAGCIGSSSSVPYFPGEVADSQGNMVLVTTGVYQYLVMEGTTPTATQQGAGAAVFNRSDEENRAALDFIHWLTVNKGFELATSMSHMPVDNNGMTEEQERQIDDARVLKGIEIELKQNNSYQMVYGLGFENSYDVRTGVDAYFNEALSQGCMEFEEYLVRGMPMDKVIAPMDYGSKAEVFYEQVKTIFEEQCLTVSLSGERRISHEETFAEQ